MACSDSHCYESIMRMVAALLLLLSVFGGHAVALERAAAKAGPGPERAAVFLVGDVLPDETRAPHAAMTAEAPTFVSAAHAPCKTQGDCVFLVPTVAFAASGIAAERASPAATDWRPFHIRRLLRPPIA